MGLFSSSKVLSNIWFCSASASLLALRQFSNLKLAWMRITISLVEIPMFLKNRKAFWTIETVEVFWIYSTIVTEKPSISLWKFSLFCSDSLIVFLALNRITGFKIILSVCWALVKMVYFSVYVLVVSSMLGVLSYHWSRCGPEGDILANVPVVWRMSGLERRNLQHCTNVAKEKCFCGIICRKFQLSVNSALLPNCLLPEVLWF